MDLLIDLDDTHKHKQKADERQNLESMSQSDLIDIIEELRFKLDNTQSKLDKAESKNTHDWALIGYLERQLDESTLKLTSTTEKEIMVSSKPPSSRKDFAVMLLDGNTAMFLHEFVAEGRVGGVDFAGKLKNAIRLFLHHCTDRREDIVIRIYSNRQHWERHYPWANVEGFIHGFQMSKSRYDIVDVGPSLADGDDMVARRIKMEGDAYLKDDQCISMLLGVPPNKEYSDWLEQYKEDKRVTIIHKIAMEETDFLSNFPTIHLPELFQHFVPQETFPEKSKQPGLVEARRSPKTRRVVTYNTVSVRKDGLHIQST